MPTPVVVLEWTFTPADFFEERTSITRQDYSLVAEDGGAKATISAQVFDADPSIRERLTSSIQDRMHGIQLISHKPFTLSKPRMIRVRPDGGRDIFVELEGATLTLTAGDVDVRVTDKDGNVVRDSKQERLSNKWTLAELVSKFRGGDSLLTALLKSYDESTRDPDNELVHLYEIRDALWCAFGRDERATCSALGLSSSDWSQFGRLCCYERLAQGRHRGLNVGSLRDATEVELADARKFSRSMIEAYLRYRDAGTNAP